jgi:predicted HicB family RNase H-like nuclease
MKEKRKWRVLPLSYAEARVRFIPLDLWKKARMQAMEMGLTVNKYVIEAITEKVDRKEKTR